MPLTLAAMGIGVATGVGEGIYGAIQKRNAQRAAAANVMPTYTPSPYEGQITNLAESQAGTGMSDAARQALLNNSNTGLATSVGAIEKMGGNPNSIGSAYQNYNTNINNQAIYDDSQRMAHLSNLQGAYSRASAVADKAWQINQYQPWANRAQAIAGQLQGGQNMMMAGINTAAGGVMSGLSALGRKNNPSVDTGGGGQGSSGMGQQISLPDNSGLSASWNNTGGTPAMPAMNNSGFSFDGGYSTSEDRPVYGDINKFSQPQGSQPFNFPSFY